MGYCPTHNQNYDEQHGGFCYQCRDAANDSAFFTKLDKLISTTSTNTGSPKMPPSCTECPVKKICHVSPGYGMLLCKETWQQLRADA